MITWTPLEIVRGLLTLPSVCLLRESSLPPHHGCEMMGQGNPRLEGGHGLSEVQGAPCHARDASISLNSNRKWKLIRLVLHQTSSQQI